MTNFEGLFNAKGQSIAKGGANQLSQTATLTSIATTIATDVMNVIGTEVEKYNSKIAASKESHDAMDALIAEAYPSFDAVDVTFLSAESKETLEKMLRSQQSKRSRAKSKVMTMDNYKAMMIGAVAEMLVRKASGATKTGGGTVGTDIKLYTEEELQELAADQDKLKKLIRNVQSRKSIMKSKADYDETSDKWITLLAIEEQLKSIRLDSNGTVVVKAVDPQLQKDAEDKKKIEEMVADLDPSKMKANDAKSMIEAIKEMLASK